MKIGGYTISGTGRQTIGSKPTKREARKEVDKLNQLGRSRQGSPSFSLSGPHRRTRKGKSVQWYSIVKDSYSSRWR
jgi:hypothetical protein